MRVLHVIEAGRPLLREFVRPRPEEGFDDRVHACRIVTELSCDSHDHRVCVMGSCRAAARTARLGLAPGVSIGPLLGRPNMAPGPMGRLIRSVRPDVVHWWNAPWTGGCFGRPGRAWHLESVIGSTPLKLPLWLSGGGAVACGPVEESRAARAGLAVFAVNSPVVAPAPRNARPAADAPARLLLLGPGADARQFIFLCGLIVGVEVKLEAVIPGSAASLPRARRFRRDFQHHLDITVSHKPREDLLSQCNAAVWMGGGRDLRAGGHGHGVHLHGPSAMAIRSALAAGVPVIVPPEAAWAIPGPLRPTLVSLNATPGEMTRKLVMLLEHRASLDRVRAEGPPLATGANIAFVKAILDAYEGRAATSVERPEAMMVRHRVESPAA